MDQPAAALIKDLKSRGMLDDTIVHWATEFGRMPCSQGSKGRPANRRVAQWMRDYVRLPGIPDEYIGQDGAPRPVWTRFFDAFAASTPGDIERLTQRIDELLSDPQRLREARQRARATVAAHFTWENCGRQTVSAYEHALR